MSEIPRVASSERSLECQAAYDAADIFRQGLAASEAESGCSWGIGVGVGTVEGEWCVAIRVTEKDVVPVAEYFANAFIPDVPVDIQYVGRIRAS